MQPFNRPVQILQRSNNLDRIIQPKHLWANYPAGCHHREEDRSDPHAIVSIASPDRQRDYPTWLLARQDIRLL